MHVKFNAIDIWNQFLKAYWVNFKGKRFLNIHVILSCVRNYLLDLKGMNTGSMFYIFQGWNLDIHRHTWKNN